MNRLSQSEQSPANGQAVAMPTPDERVVACVQEVNTVMAKYACRFVTRRMEIDGQMGPVEIIIVPK